MLEKSVSKFFIEKRPVKKLCTVVTHVGFVDLF